MLHRGPRVDDDDAYAGGFIHGEEEEERELYGSWEEQTEGQRVARTGDRARLSVADRGGLVCLRTPTLTLRHAWLIQQGHAEDEERPPSAAVRADQVGGSI